MLKKRVLVLPMLVEPNTMIELEIIIAPLTYIIPKGKTNPLSTNSSDSPEATMVDFVAIVHAKIRWNVRVGTSHPSYHSCVN